MGVYVNPAGPRTTLDDLVFEYDDTKVVSADYSKVNPAAVAREQKKTEDWVREGKIQDNPILMLLNRDGNKFKLGRSSYGQFRTYRDLVATGELPGVQPTFQTFTIIIELISSDGYLVLGHRKGEHVGGRYLAPAGFLDFKGQKLNSGNIKKFLENKVKEELLEEVGVENAVANAKSVGVIGYTYGTTHSYTSVLVTTVKSSLTRDEIQKCWQEKGSKKEHPHLIYIPNKLEDILGFLARCYTGNVGHSGSPIIFENGKCVKGPEEINGKEYQLIENGVGGMLAGINYHFGAEAFGKAVELYKQAKDAEKVGLNSKYV